MKKTISIIATLVIFCSIAKAQWEFQYFVLRFGLTHHMFSNQPDSFPNKYLNSPNGELQLTPSKNFVDYVPGAHASLTFHYDFDNDKGGIILGLDYSFKGISSKYETKNKKYTLIEKFYVHSIGIPLAVKFGNEIFDRQHYGFLGIQYNFNISGIITESSNINNKVRSTALPKAEIAKNNYMIFIGYNYMIFNIELDFMPQNFFNTKYVKNLNKNGAVYNIKPYECQPKKLFFVKTSLNIPLSPWTSKKSYKIHKALRKLF